MRCGSKCFLVEMKRNGMTETIPVTARSPIGARKVIRNEYAENVEILVVKEEKRK
ncbi:hypothetical protein ACFSKI_08150 [Pseudogracilibacillus auburnensis]|uniref:Uncharacterized protein n=1 Tax=Pseudogracilibacillus auburnensis TaxID=1494959 RepID=A0A2V3VSH7_9BACI|nr:hypothetical protein [Pseudogracilibacillus auburnensis]MBO1003896.1 hypothetical protein [Pseudogracilibacillus auburnensis]PXW84823.1 hypothetical protein DFR56_11367 [Pseudogracilibacillus auburnensis]